MAIYAEFIGIDKYDNPRIGDLNGAERDALALHALFTDSVPGLSAKLLLSKEATLENVERALRETLMQATEDDVAIFFFAGHGAPDHRLVLSNSDPSNHAATTLAMDRIATAFKETRARIAICMLDCCFSGGAPARVFTEIPLPRGHVDSTSMFAGKGRVLITASASHEPAYEHPLSRHGLFTMALLDALQDADADPSLVTIMADVLDRVRAEAARMGIDQTPVFLGSVEGGLGLPKLRKGETYRRAFPSTRSVKVGAPIVDLAALGFPDIVLKRWSKLFPNGLNQLQLDAVNEHGLLQGRSLLAVAPTSAGKTFIGELAAVKAVTDGKKSVFLLPYKALVNEKFDQFTTLYGEALGMRVIRCTGDYQDQTAEILKGKFDLALLTYEMFLNLVVANPHILTQVGLVVVDEAQFITDPTRGISIELLLTMLLAARSRGIEPQLVCLSAVIGSVNSFDEWLGAEKLVRTDRPVALIEGVIDRSGTYQYRDEDGQIREERLVAGIFQRRDKPSAQDVIVPLVAKLVRDGEQVIVFRNQRGSAQGCARYLASDLGLGPSPSLSELPENDLSKASRDLRYCLQHGTAFHTSNLHKEERAIVERAFRDPNSNVRALAATTTVAAGINTPASTVIIAEQEFVGEDGRLFTVAEYKNMAGRAGRLGFKERGKCIIYAETPMERQRLFQRYVLGALEPITSSFKPSDLETWVLRLLAQVRQAKREEVPSLLANTFGGFLLTRAQPDWSSRLPAEVERVLTRMIDLGLVEVIDDHVKLTLLGFACGRSALSFGSSLRLVELLRSLNPQTLTAELLVAVLQALPESSGGYTPMMKKGQSEFKRSNQASLRFGNMVVVLLQRGSMDQMDYLARCKRAAILGDWIDGVPIEDIESKYTSTQYQGAISAGHVRGFADATRLYYRAAFNIAFLVHPDGALDADEVDLVMRRLEVGVPKVALPILDFLPNIDRGTCLAMHRSGLVTVNAVLQLPQEGLAAAVGTLMAKAILSNLQKNVVNV